MTCTPPKRRPFGRSGSVCARTCACVRAPLATPPRYCVPNCATCSTRINSYYIYDAASLLPRASPRRQRLHLLRQPHATHTGADLRRTYPQFRASLSQLVSLCLYMCLYTLSLSFSLSLSLSLQVTYRSPPHHYGTGWHSVCGVCASTDLTRHPFTC